MKQKLSPPWSDYLEYLEGIGYDELYVEPAAVGRGQAAGASPTDRPGAPQGPPRQPRARPGGAQRPVQTRQAQPGPSSPDHDRGMQELPPATPIELPPGPLPDDPVERSQQLVEVARRVAGCHQCTLCRRRRKVVFGAGHPNAELMLIGEGPGAEEDRRGLPFVGAAGELLTRILQAIELEREQVYIANVVKCRPPRNRDPLPDEVAACRPFLERQIDLVRPRVIVTLGRVAAQCLLDRTDSLGRMRGRWYDVRGVATRVTYHPAALLRNRDFKRPTWEDMQLVRDRLRGLDV